MIKEFTWYGPSEYAGQLLQEGVDYEDRVSIYIEMSKGPTANFLICWYDLAEREEGYSPKLELWGGAWYVLDLTELLDFFVSLANEKVQPEELVEKLKEAGFNDETPYGDGICPHCYSKMS